MKITAPNLVGIVAGAVAAGVLCPTAFAQDGTAAARRAPIAPGAFEAIAPLDDPIFEVRRQSEQRLIEGGWGTLDQLHAMLASGRLSPEQHVRVRRIAIARFVSTPRAGMGVQFNLGAPGEARIEQLVEGFPAGEVIRPGDQIVEAAGVEVGNSAQLGALILSHDPGDVMAVRVIREEEPYELDVPLGSFGDLRQNTPNPRTLASAYHARARRDHAPARPNSGALGSGLTLDDWTRAELGNEPPESLPGGVGSARRPGATRESVVGGVAHPRPAETQQAFSARSGSSASAWLQRRGELARRRAVVEAQWNNARAQGEQGTQRELRGRLDKYDAALADMNRRLGQIED